MIEELKILLDAGKSSREVASILGVSQTHVRYMAKSNGFKFCKKTSDINHKNCIGCGVNLSNKRSCNIYCSNQCKANYDFNVSYEAFLKNEHTTSTPRVLKKFIEKRDGKNVIAAKTVIG